MIAKEFNEVNVRIAENQEEYETLPVFHDPKEGSVTMCFEANDAEKAEIAKTGKIWIKILTFNNPLQPIAMSCLKEDLIKGT